MSKLSSTTLERLKSIPKSKCAICASPRSYTNPMEKCDKCGKKFCYSHIYEELRGKGLVNLCDNCYK